MTLLIYRLVLLTLLVLKKPMIIVTMSFVTNHCGHSGNQRSLDDDETQSSIASERLLETYP